MQCSELLARKGLTIAFAESATAGRLAAEFALTPASGKILIGGLVCYDASVKQNILKVPAELIRYYTPESAEVTRELAIRLQKYLPAGIHVAITGLTTPGGSETPEKPVGTMFIHIQFGEKGTGIRQVYTGSQQQIMMKTINRVAKLILSETCQ
jgi:nicotinamide-nucleotide amidase